MPNSPTTLPPPPLPSKPNSDRPPMPPRIHPRFGHINGPPAEPYSGPMYPKKKSATTIKFRDMLSPYKITSRIVINNDGTVSHESAILGHLGGIMDRSPLIPMRKKKSVNTEPVTPILCPERSVRKYQHLKNSVSFLVPPKNIPRHRLPSPPNRNANDNDDDVHEKDWIPSPTCDPVQRHKPQSYTEPVSSKEIQLDDSSTNYVTIPDVDILDYINFPDYLSVSEMNRSPDKSLPDYVDEIDSIVAASAHHSKSPTPEVESNSDIMDKDFINVTKILKELSPPVAPASPTSLVTCHTSSKPVIKHRTLRQINSNANWASKHACITSKAKSSTPSDVSTCRVTRAPVPHPRNRLPSSTDTNQSSTSMPPELKSNTAKDTELTSSVSPDKISTVKQPNSESQLQPVKNLQLTVFLKPTGKNTTSPVLPQQLKKIKLYEQHQLQQENKQVQLKQQQLQQQYQQQSLQQQELKQQQLQQENELMQLQKHQQQSDQSLQQLQQQLHNCQQQQIKQHPSHQQPVHQQQRNQHQQPHRLDSTTALAKADSSQSNVGSFSSEIKNKFTDHVKTSPSIPKRTCSLSSVRSETDVDRSRSSFVKPSTKAFSAYPLQHIPEHPTSMSSISSEAHNQKISQAILKKPVPKQRIKSLSPECKYYNYFKYVRTCMYIVKNTHIIWISM